MTTHASLSVRSTAPGLLDALCAAFRVRTAANCNVLMADRISLPVAEHREDREEAAVEGEGKGWERVEGRGMDGEIM